MITAMRPLRRSPPALSTSLILLLTAGCATLTTPRQAPPSVVAESAELLPPSERDRRFAEAVGLIEGQQVGRGLNLLFAIVDDDAEDEPALYLLGRTLQQQGSLRPARAQLQRLVSLNAKHSLAWQRLGEIQQRLGEHSRAIACFQRVAELVSNTVDPLLRIASNQVLHGQPEQALVALDRARQRLKELKRRDALVEYLSARAYRELEDPEAEATAARSFLEIARNKPRYKNEFDEYRRWLAARALVLNSAQKQTLIRYARATLEKILDGPGSPVALGKEADERLFSFDEASVFITVFPAGGLGEPLVARGSKESLLRSAAHALSKLLALPGYNKALCRRSALRISIRAKAPEAVLVQARSDGRLRATPELRAGLHGVYVESGDERSFALPGDAVSEACGDLGALLRLACRRAGLGAEGWQQRRVYRFETTSFVSLGPNSSIIDLEAGEPLPRPVPDRQGLGAALLSAGEWLKSAQQPNGCFAGTYDPRRDRMLTPKSDELKLINLEGLTTLSVKAIQASATSPLSWYCDAGTLTVPMRSPTSAGLEGDLRRALKLEASAAQLSSGVVTTACSLALREVRSEPLKVMLEGLVNGLVLADQARAGRAQLSLFALSGQAAYLASATRVADWLVERLDERAGLEDLAETLRLLCGLRDVGAGASNATLEAARLSTSRSLRARLAANAVPTDEPRLAAAILEALTLDARFGSGADLASAAAVADRSLNCPNDALGSASLGRALLGLARRFDVRSDRELGARPSAWEKKARAIADALGAKLRDPADAGLDGGGVGRPGDRPDALVTAQAAALFSDLAADPTSPTDTKSRATLAALAAAGFQLRHQLGPKHGYFLPRVERASGGFHRDLADLSVTLETMSSNIEALLGVRRLLDARR